MTTLTATQARQAFGRMLKAAERGPVLITRRSCRVAAFFSLSGFEGAISDEAIRQAIAAKLAAAPSPTL